MLIPCFLKPSSIAVLFDDKTQTPPHQPRVLRPSRSKDGTVKPLRTHELRDLHMSIATSPYRPLMMKNVPIQEWLNKLFDLMKERQHFVDDDSFANYSGYECDEQDVFLVTSRHLDGLLNQAEAACVKQCSLPGLLFPTCCRMPATIALLSGFQYYPSAFGSKPRSRRQEPLPSLEVCCNREKKFGKPPVCFFLCQKVLVMQMAICRM